MGLGIVKIAWAGTSGGPGLTPVAVNSGTGNVWTATNANAATAAARAFFASQAVNLPNELSLTVQPAVDQYAPETGELTGTVTASPAPTPVAGTSAGGYAGGVGLKIDWQTGIIRKGRRLVGHTYMVPIVASCFDNDGTLLAGTLTSFTTSGNTLISSLTSAGLALSVWSRPSQKGLNDGAVFPVTGCAVKDKSAFQRGRRE
jgi:hypothetical protein